MKKIVILMLAAFVVAFSKSLWVVWHGHFTKGEASLEDYLSSEMLLEALIYFVAVIAAAVILHFIWGQLRKTVE